MGQPLGKQIRIRCLDVANPREVQQWLALIAQGGPAFLHPPENEGDVQRLCARCETLVAVQGEQLVGTVTLEDHNPTWRVQTELRFCIVDPAHRRVGIARQLLREAIARAGTSVGTTTMLIPGADAALRLIEHMDFQEYERAAAGTAERLPDGTEELLTCDIVRYRLDR